VADGKRGRAKAPRKGDGLLRTAQARERPPVEGERRLIALLLQKLDPRLLPAALQGIRQIVAEQS
jgi:hypothetical protein